MLKLEMLCNLIIVLCSSWYLKSTLPKLFFLNFFFLKLPKRPLAPKMWLSVPFFISAVKYWAFFQGKLKLTLPSPLLIFLRRAYFEKKSFYCIYLAKSTLCWYNTLFSWRHERFSSGEWKQVPFVSSHQWTVG